MRDQEDILVKVVKTQVASPQEAAESLAGALILNFCCLSHCCGP